MASDTTLALGDVAATHALAAEWAARARPGDVLALVGDLGAGKTEFTRGLARALGTPPDVAVCSPTYLLLNVYSGGRLPLAHFDAYLMESDDDLERAGFDDLRRDGHLVVVEWADRVSEALPDGTVWLAFEPGEGPDERRVRIVTGRRPPPGFGD